MPAPHRPSVHVVFGVLFLWALAAGAPPCAGQARDHTVSGQVVEITSGTWIGGATVTLSGRGPYISDQRGQFRFERVPPGTHSIQIEAMGYRTQAVSITISKDTEILVEMEVDPIRLDSLLVEAGYVEVRGKVVDAETESPVPEARIRVGNTPEVYANSRGNFRVKDLPRGHSISVLVDAFKYRPARIALITERDTTLTIPMEADPVSIRLFQRTVDQLEVRSRGVHLPRTELDRRFIQLFPHRSVNDLIKGRLRRDFSPDCVFVDEIKYSFGEILESYKAWEVERIEIFGGGAMIRVYTQDFVARHFGRADELPRIIYVKPSMGSAICH